MIIVSQDRESYVEFRGVGAINIQNSSNGYIVYAHVDGRQFKLGTYHTKQDAVGAVMKIGDQVKKVFKEHVSGPVWWKVPDADNPEGKNIL